ncbi:UDP-2,4-diacetamido-2,4,6-trideoxy-beta-L-altropyranose hydrolase [Oceaniserpentilla sp. 4NH20-0058]|uniref:UDP-2,4-diacetamido-2,4, 6-trideoxy-beta-L-altropyranose hydrolase n=1 Tax=Oceaniserpentilla sp. 4NH20-0058 TaxID=3127660 RepID=UPI003109DEB2
MIMQAVFRVDSSEKMGFGHVSRCLTLADELSHYGFQCAFICQQLSGNGIDLIEHKKYRVHVIDDHSNAIDSQTKDAEKTQSIIRQHYKQVNLFVVDQYNLDATWERILLDSTNTLFVMDDLANRQHDCHFLLDVNIQREASDYKQLCKPKTKLLIGSDFTLLRDEFLQQRKLVLEKRKTTSGINQILLSFGATDPTHLTLDVLAILNTMPCKSRIEIAVSSKCSWLDRFDASIYKNLTIHMNVDTHNIVQLMSDSDLAIGAIGGSTWERACLGLPCISITNSDLQTPIAEFLHDHQLIVHSKLEDLKIDMEPFINFNFYDWYRYSKNNSELIDGLGCKRVLKGIVASSIKFESLTLEYADSLFDWQCQPEARQYSRNPNPPSYSEHINWLNTSLTNEKRRMWVIILMGVAVGYVRLDELTDCFEDERKSELLESETTEEISILISDVFHGLGIGKLALSFLQKNMKHETLIATVDDLNTPSIKLFTSNGFKLCAHQTYVFGRSYQNANH